MGDIAWLAAQWTFWIALFCGTAYALPFLAWSVTESRTAYGSRVTSAVGAMGVGWALFFTVAGIIWLINFDAKQDAEAHVWKDGAGSATVCQYEDRQVWQPVGKGGYYRTQRYTVCRDPR